MGTVLLPIAALMITLVFSLLVTRIATVALMQTGLTRELARFQARSALTGVGFTTSEAEGVVGHPVRRRIIMTLMLVGQASIIGTVVTVLLSFMSVHNSAEGLRTAFAIACGIALIWALASSKYLERRLNRLIVFALKRWTKVEAYDYLQLMHLFEDYMISEIHVDEGEWLAGKSLMEAQLVEEGVQVLGIHRADGTYIGTPRGARSIRKGDRLVVYGRSRQLLELEKRPGGPDGDAAHTLSVEAHERLREEIDRLDRATNRAERDQQDQGRHDIEDA